LIRNPQSKLKIIIKIITGADKILFSMNARDTHFVEEYSLTKSSLQKMKAAILYIKIV
jgi:hypothetical protein